MRLSTDISDWKIWPKLSAASFGEIMLECILILQF